MKLNKFKFVLLDFMMAGALFGSPSQKKKDKIVEQTGTEIELSQTMYEAKANYISKVADFLNDGVKQMKKDLSI